MSSPNDAIADADVAALRHYLKANGWTSTSSGTAGSFWESGEGHGVVVPGSASGTTRAMWRSLLERVVRADDRLSAEELEFKLLGGDGDVALLRAAGGNSDSIQLDAGAVLVAGAHRLVRAAATTAQRSRAQIGSNYSMVGDFLAQSARLGHTRAGSYVIPIRMPLPVEPGEETGPDDPIAGITRVQKEPAERRVMRTLAEALAIVELRIVNPATEPSAKSVPEWVRAGVSREGLTALLSVITHPEITELSVTFEWSSNLRVPAVASSVRIPSDSAELIQTAANLLRQERRRPPESISGPIVEIRHEPDARSGSITVQTIRHGRPAEVRVTIRRERVESAHAWMLAGETVIVVGTIATAPGHPLAIRDPETVFPLSESMLSGTDQ